jgi:hypothetical protein
MGLCFLVRAVSSRSGFSVNHRPNGGLAGAHVLAIQRGRPQAFKHAERWQSGRSRRTRNAKYAQAYRGFESLPLRQSSLIRLINFKYLILNVQNDAQVVMRRFWRLQLFSSSPLRNSKEKVRRCMRTKSQNIVQRRQPASPGPTSTKIRVQPSGGESSLRNGWQWVRTLSEGNTPKLAGTNFQPANYFLNAAWMSSP